MDAITFKITYDRRSKTKITEEITGRKSITDTFDKQLCNVLIKSLVDAKVLGETYTFEDTILQSDVA